MLPDPLRNELINSFSHTPSCRRCALCGADLTSYLDEVPCPHWFITSGHRAFSERHLRSVFRVYEVPFVIEYLKLVCTFDRVGRRDFTATAFTWSISWRSRRWIFEQLADSTAGFQLSLFNGGRSAGSWQINEQVA